MKVILRKDLASLFLNHTLRVALGAIFLYASYDKLLHPDIFAERIADYRVLPHPLVNLVAVWIPILEITLAILLLAGIWTRACALLASVLVSLFIGVISSAIIRGIPLYGCGCFITSASSESVSWLSMWREGLILACALVLYGAELARAKTARDKSRFNP